MFSKGQPKERNCQTESHTFEVKDCYRVFDCNYRRNVREFGELTLQQKRAFQRLKAGITKAVMNGKMLRFMTLTTAKGCSKDINDSWNSFKMRIQRATRKPTARHKKNDGFEGFKMDSYFKLKTAEGNGVLHVVYAGTWKNYIPQSWISETWAEIHGNSEVADIRLVQNEKIANYLITNYLTNQEILRMSCSWKWLYRRFYKSWANICYFAKGNLRMALAYMRFNFGQIDKRTIVYRDLDLPLQRKKKPKRLFSFDYYDTLSYVADSLLLKAGITPK